MLNRIKNRKQEGFTIIEVLIVLAIAGLIILIVLLAVPALQRNGRNTTIKQDAGAIAGGISEFASNNDGAVPDAAGTVCATGSVTLNKGAASTLADSKPKIQGGTVVNCVGTGTQTVTPHASEINLVFGAKCDTSTGTTQTTAANGRSTAIIYAVEAQSSLVAKCTDS